MKLKHLSWCWSWKVQDPFGSSVVALRALLLPKGTFSLRSACFRATVHSAALIGAQIAFMALPLVTFQRSYLLIAKPHWGLGFLHSIWERHIWSYYYIITLHNHFIHIHKYIHFPSKNERLLNYGWFLQNNTQTGEDWEGMTAPFLVVTESMMNTCFFGQWRGGAFIELGITSLYRAAFKSLAPGFSSKLHPSPSSDSLGIGLMFSTIETSSPGLQLQFVF